MDFHVSRYFQSFMSQGFDGSDSFETFAEALAFARKSVKDRGGQAVVTEGAALIATVIRSKGRVLTKKAKRFR